MSTSHGAFVAVTQQLNCIFAASPNQTATDLQNETQSDCGGACCLFVSILRANGIPARMLIGKNIVAPPATDLLQDHVKSEFYACGIGWVPAEASNAIRYKDIVDNFGVDNGTTVAFNVDPGLQLDTSSTANSTWSVTTN